MCKYIEMDWVEELKGGNGMGYGKMTSKTKLIAVLLLIGFAFMEFPGVFFFKDMVEPYIFGLPFIYGYILLWWVYMCVILFWAYKCNWGRSEVVKKDGEES